MKTKLFSFIIFLLIAGTSKAQYPAPTNFEMSNRYIALGQQGECSGLLVEGPLQCASFQWEAPDISNTVAQLIGYNVYYYNIFGTDYEEGDEVPFSEGRIILQTTDTYWRGEMSIMGVVWVTAVYANPEGESEPSNTQIGRLATGIQEIKKPDFSLIYNQSKEGIEVNSSDIIASVSVFRLNGETVKLDAPSNSRFIDTKGWEKGIYIVKITMKGGQNISKKVTIV